MPAIPLIAAGVAAGGSLLAANKSSSAAKDAASQQTAGQQAAIAEQQRQYNLNRSDEMPYIQAGQQNLALLGKLNSGDYSSFHTSPDYNFSLTQGIQGLDKSAAARGALFDGGHSADVLNFAEGLANKNYDDYYNKIAGLANLGQDATARTGALGAGAANAIGDAYGQIGNAQAQGTIGSANAFANGANALGSAFGKISQTGWGQGYNGAANTNGGYVTPATYGRYGFSGGYGG